MGTPPPAAHVREAAPRERQQVRGKGAIERIRIFALASFEDTSGASQLSSLDWSAQLRSGKRNAGCKALQRKRASRPSIGGAIEEAGNKRAKYLQQGSETVATPIHEEGNSPWSKTSRYNVAQHLSPLYAWNERARSINVLTSWQRTLTGQNGDNSRLPVLVKRSKTKGGSMRPQSHSAERALE
eukprot:6193634-Pleurochrysis_carterae.AAC.6